MAYKNPKSAKVLARRAAIDFKYYSSEKGFIQRTIGRMFKPSAQKSRFGKEPRIPECSRKDIWPLLLLHIQLMKEQVPGSDGRICRYCLQPWKYQVTLCTRGQGYKKRTRTYWDNFSIDRLYSDHTYKVGNIIFCCSKCNSIKNATTKKDWIRYLEVAKENDEEQKLAQGFVKMYHEVE